MQGRNRIKRAFSLIVFLFLFLGCTAPEKRDLSSHQEMKTFMQSASAKKLNTGLQRKLLALEEKNATDERLDLLLGLKTPPTEAEKDRLRQEGVLLRSVVGTVATATAPAEKIPTISLFDFIERIELAAPLRPKGDQNEEP